MDARSDETGVRITIMCVHPTAAQPSPATSLVFYDGVCGLCNRFVRFLLARDQQGVLRFARLQGPLAARELGSRGHDPNDLDTVFVIAGWNTDRPAVLSRSRAVLHALGQLGPGWRALSALAGLIPRPVADAVYDVIARRRYRVFGRYETCSLPPPEWRARFEDEGRTEDDMTH